MNSKKKNRTVTLPGLNIRHTYRRTDPFAEAVDFCRRTVHELQKR